MSRLLEAIQRGRKGPSKDKTNREMTQEQLSDIYFSGAEKDPKSQPPLVIRVVEAPRWASLVPWIIASVAFLITAFSLFSTKRIFVDFQIIDEKNPYWSAINNPDFSPETLSPVVSEPVAAAAAKEEGRPMALENLVFEGAARLKSSKNKQGLTLINSSLAPFARATLPFDSPLNLTRAKIVFYARGARGGENVAVAFKDTGSNLAFTRGKVYPFPGGLTTRWQKAEISLLDSVPGFDKTQVVSVRLDFGSKDTENKPGDVVFIKDLRVVTLD
ncbi:MAG: hypothetical protein HYT89_00160 [Candidatus Omnitrophica bacterium]|nr:hypothetical protein [Candidatus Omnitrophota bacterium]